MHAIRSIVDDAANQLLIELPPELRHRRLEVIVLPLDDQGPTADAQLRPRYQTLRVAERVIVGRDELHER
ncbi:hypothetical protein [uncultured Thiodictyon sp.]|uniref:hypothetical protein n=1 Tax=uncultured Thiodictyon sp. TaxID=1846217 RepID=UPI0025D02771|nr:hypothetical protein [uncultured Thiodictyon sp.]